MSVRDTAFSVIHDSQKTFRVVLDCMARPGKINQLPQLDLKGPLVANPYVLTILRTLLDQKVTFAVIGQSPAVCHEIQAYLELNTGSRATTTAKADFVYSVNGCTHEEVLNFKRGSIELPEEGATIIYHVDSIRSLDQSPLALPTIVLCLRGPGILQERRVVFAGSGLAEELAYLTKTRALYPLGVEAIFVDRNGNVVGLPRTTTIDIE